MQLDTFTTWITNVRVVNKDLVTIPVNVKTDSILITEGAVTQINEAENSLLLYPNPIKEYFYIKTEIKSQLEFRVHDSMGRLVYEEINSFARATKIDVNAWSRGLYVLELRGGDFYEQRKILVY